MSRYLPARRFEPKPGSKFRVRLDRVERALLAKLCAEADGVLGQRAETAWRLFQVAYPADADSERDYQAMVGEELLRSHQESLHLLAAGANAEVLDEEELHRWMDAIEVMRLVLGTQLGVTSDMEAPGRDDPTAMAYAIYVFLSGLQDDAVDALSSLLPEDSPSAG